MSVVALVCAMLLIGGPTAAADCTFTTMPAPNPSHQAIALTDPAGEQTAYFDLYWGGVLGSLRQGATERLWGHHPIGMAQPRWFYYPAGPPPAQPYELVPAGDTLAKGRPALGAACVDKNTVSIMNGLTDYAAGTSGYKVLSGTVDGGVVSGMYVAPYAYSTLASFVPNPSPSPPGAPSYYLRFQQRLANDSDAELFAFGLWMRNAVPNSYTYTKQAPTSCTTSASCDSNVTAYLVAGRYPASNFTNGIAFAVAPSSYWRGINTHAWAVFDTDTANQHQRVSLVNAFWSVAPSVPPTSTTASRVWEWYVLAGDWTSALNFTVRPRIWSMPSPASGPRTGGTTLTVDGSKFVAGATVMLGTAAATGVAVQNPAQLTATTPANPAGAANLKITNPDGTSDTLTRGFVYDFDDVPATHALHEHVVLLARSGITSGCGSNSYCVNTAIPREQMAVFLLRAKYGAAYVPPACTPPPNQVFTDVPCPSQYANWIEQLNEEGITSGCGPTTFCPSDPVPRNQMAVFLGKTRWGTGYTPAAPSGCVFGDITPSAFAANWIEVVRWAGVMGAGAGSPSPCSWSPGQYPACSFTPTCLFSPNTSVTRGNMAVYMRYMFNLQ